jgi:hypothetical protein
VSVTNQRKQKYRADIAAHARPMYAPDQPMMRVGRQSDFGSTLASLGPPADKEHAIDSTIVRAHQHAAGVKGGIKIKKRSAVRAAGSRPKSASVPL